MCSLMCSAALVGFSSANKKISCFLSLSFQPLTFHGCFLFFSVSRWFLRICVAGVHSGHTERCIFTCFIPFWHYKYLFLSGFLSLQQLLFSVFAISGVFSAVCSKEKMSYSHQTVGSGLFLYLLLKFQFFHFLFFGSFSVNLHEVFECVRCVLILVLYIIRILHISGQGFWFSGRLVQF